MRAGDKLLLDGAAFAIERGEHVALVGPNGSGKTTLLETLLGLRDAESGKVRLGHGVVPAYFSQHEAELDERGSVLDAAMSGTGLKRPEAQSLLGRFLFSGWDEHEKPVVALSGGERRRLALAIVVASGANFLVLDEPTNHLDLESRESLEAALEAFPGTVLLVSHDRALLDAVADRLLAVESAHDRVVSGRLGRLRTSAGSTGSLPRRRPRSRRSRSGRSGPRSRSRRRSTRSRRRSSGRRRVSPRSSRSSPPTGRTSSWSRRTSARATSSTRCSGAGNHCSKRADRRLADRVGDEDRLVGACLRERLEVGGQRARREPAGVPRRSAARPRSRPRRRRRRSARGSRDRVPPALRPHRSRRSPRRSLRPCCRSGRTTCSSSRRAGADRRASSARSRRASASAPSSAAAGAPRRRPGGSGRGTSRARPRAAAG